MISWYNRGRLVAYTISIQSVYLQFANLRFLDLLKFTHFCCSFTYYQKHHLTSILGAKQRVQQTL
jgi:hypothetical protein